MRKAGAELEMAGNKYKNILSTFFEVLVTCWCFGLDDHMTFSPSIYISYLLLHLGLAGDHS